MKPPPWTELPRDITANILQRLNAVEILENAQKVCTTWRSVCRDPAMWRVIDMCNLGEDGMPYDIDAMPFCRKAVDWSQGQLVNISIRDFATDELLEFIAERAGKLRRLQLVRCFYLTDEGISEAIKRFPMLEELHILLTPFSDETIETIGRSCPLLRSFTFNSKICSYFNEAGNEEAFAIARSMPELHHLQLLGNGLTNEGLQAIMDGCPHLETLDLRRCYHVVLWGDFGNKCAARIKRLRYPNDSIEDYEFQVEDSDSFEGDSYLFDPDFYDYEDYDYDDYHLYYDDYSRPYPDIFDDCSDFENFPFFD